MLPAVAIARALINEPDVLLADAVAREAIRRGVLMFTTGRGYLKFTPPLGIHVDAALEAADVLKCSLSTLLSSRDETKTVYSREY